MLLTIIAAVFSLGLLIMIHELGHFLAAKAVGIRVERFSLGFPPILMSIKRKFDGVWVKVHIPWFLQRWLNAAAVSYRIPRKRPLAGETEYTVGWTPLGGYVKLAGMIDESLDTSVKGKPWEFTSKPRWQQLLVVTAGVIMNTILALVIFTAILRIAGLEEPDNTTIVGSLTKTENRQVYPAEAAGIKEGDVILAVNDQEVKDWDAMVAAIRQHAGEKVKITWRHGNQVLSDSVPVVKEVVPTPKGRQEIGIIGISRHTVHREVGWGEAVVLGTKNTFLYGTMMARTLGELLTGRASMQELGGPIMIAKMAGDMARRGWVDIFYFIAVISINLAFLNILPIPGLDGGHILIITLEGIIRRPLPVKAKMIIQQIGLFFLLALIIFITINDISKL